MERIFSLEELLDTPKLGNPYINILGHVYEVIGKNDDGTLTIVKVAEFGPGCPIYDDETERLREAVREILKDSDSSKCWFRTPDKKEA